MPGVTAAVAAFANLMEALDDLLLRQVAGLFQVPKQVIALGVDVRSGYVGNLPGVAAQADLFVIHGGPDPDGTSVRIDLVRLPEPDVVALARIVADRLFKGEVLLAPE